MSAFSFLLLAVSPTLDAVIPPPQPRMPQAESMRSMPKAELFDRPTPPRGNIPALFSNDDNPLDALRDFEEGTVGVILKIDELGRIADCLVEFSSGSPSLDAQTCRILWLRARFEPARSKSGKPIESALRQRIRWQIPEPDLPPLANGHASLAITFAKDGSISACRYEMANGTVNFGQDCLNDPAAKAMITAQFRDAIPLRGKTLVQENHLIVDDRPLPRFGEGANETLLGRSSVEFTIGESGRPVGCWVIERGTGPSLDPCGTVEKMLFGKPPASDSRIGPIKVRYVMGGYTRP